jgi:hypothetical protein
MESHLTVTAQCYNTLNMITLARTKWLTNSRPPFQIGWLPDAIIDKHDHVGKQLGVHLIFDHQHELNGWLMLPTIIESLMGFQFSTIQFQEPSACSIPLIESGYTNSIVKNLRNCKMISFKIEM